MKNDPLNFLYERNPETGNYVIEISLDTYGDVFNEWDHASYRKRDMDPELAFFLEDSSAEIPLRYGIELVFYLPKQEMDREKEGVIAAVVKNYYRFYADLERRTLQRTYRRMLNYLLSALVLLTSTYIFSYWQQTFFLAILSEGLSVGSWFCMWEAISFLLFERSEIVTKVKSYDRLSNAPIYYRYDP
ncbi:MAG TPA: hypothetical protein GX738_04560 [Firmicutes bacterium]|jgi:hypothetical protein|nr:hypothetical protein [Bacillota bacterium]